jgi:predicted esterase
VRLSAEVLRRLGAEVTMRLYPGMGHTINEDEIAAVRRMMEPQPSVIARRPSS